VANAFCFFSRRRADVLHADFHSGFFAIRQRGVGNGLRWFSYVYFVGMVLRYVLTMTYYPERRWLSGTIPIFFHWVLAGYLFILGQYYGRQTD